VASPKKGERGTPSAPSVLGPQMVRSTAQFRRLVRSRPTAPTWPTARHFLANQSTLISRGALAVPAYRRTHAPTGSHSAARSAARWPGSVAGTLREIGHLPHAQPYLSRRVFGSPVGSRGTASTPSTPVDGRVGGGPRCGGAVRPGGTPVPTPVQPPGSRVRGAATLSEEFEPRGHQPPGVARVRTREPVIGVAACVGVERVP
jgi:hypothetical protein